MYVCKFAHCLLSLRNKDFSNLNDNSQQFSLHFQFEQKDIERLRKEMLTLITNLELVYQEQQKGKTHLIISDDDNEEMQIVDGEK